MSNNSFFDDVFEVVRLIPKGKISTYGAIAEYLGTKGSSRMVGWALNQCNDSGMEDIPAHRVVNRKGLLTGKIHFKGRSMEDLLRKDGVRVSNNQIKNFEELLWEPAKELL
jgi:methylated-DNA-protein-cysteine methyltransferase related protein